VELIVGEVRDCGIELTAAPVKFEDLANMVGNFPHNGPGTDRPFDVFMIAIGLSGFDPGFDMFDTFDSSRITGPDHPQFDPFAGAANVEGYSNPQVDQLLQQARVVYDQRERARLYLQAQETIAQDQPLLFCWSPLTTEFRGTHLSSTSGPLEEGVPNSFAQLETLLVAAH
jgi:peptide/nickel transport system substrate-binding protein